MIFQRTAAKVRTRRKTQTRRIKKQGEFSGRDDMGNLCVYTPSGRVKWRVGSTVSVQDGRGKKGNGRIVILDIRNDVASRISEADAIAEGFDSREGFLTLWREMHKKDDQDVLVIVFRIASIPNDTGPRCLGCGVGIPSYKLDFCYDCTMEQFWEALE